MCVFRLGEFCSPFLSKYLTMELTLKEKDLLEEIARVCLANDGVCDIPDKAIMASQNVSERTYYRTLSSLEEKELIKRDTHSIGYYGKSRIITLLYPKGYSTKYSTDTNYNT